MVKSILDTRVVKVPAHSLVSNYMINLVASWNPVIFLFTKKCPETMSLLFIIILGFFIPVLALITWVFEVAWNAVMAGVFHFPELSFWSALAFMAILSIIGSFFTNSK